MKITETLALSLFISRQSVGGHFITENAMHHSKRNQNLVEMREMVMRICNDKSLNVGQLQTLLSDRRFCQILFNLFDERESNLLRQADWFSQMKEWTEVAIGRLTSP